MDATDPQMIEALTQVIEKAGEQVWRVTAFANGTGRALWLVSGPLLMVPASGELFLQGPHAAEIEPKLRAAGVFDHPLPMPSQPGPQADPPPSRADRIRSLLQDAGHKVVHELELEMGRVMMLACQVSVMVPEEGDLQYKGKDIDPVRTLIEEALAAEAQALSTPDAASSDAVAAENAPQAAVTASPSPIESKGVANSGAPGDERGPSGSVVQILEDHGEAVWQVTPYAQGQGRAIWLQSGPLVMVPPRGCCFVQGRGDLQKVTQILRETGLID